MNADRLLELYEQISEAPDAISRLRRFVLDLAVRGKLVEQDATEEAVNLPTEKKLVSAVKPVPSGWAASAVGQVLNFQYGKGKKKSERLEQGPVPVFGSNGVVGFSEEHLTKKDAIIIGRKGSAGALNLCTGPSWTTDVAYFVEAPTEYQIRYLLLTLKSLGLDALGKGVKPGLSRADAYPLEVHIPPLAEQHRIVAKVDELMVLCDRLEEARKTREETRDKLTAATLARLTAPEGTAASETDGTNAPFGAAPNQAEQESTESGPLSGTASEQASDFPTHARFAIETLPALTSRPDQIKSLRQTILNLAVRGKLVEQDSADEPASKLVEGLSLERVRLMKAGKIPKKPEPSRDPERGTADLPLNWKWIALGDICNLVTSGSRGWGQYYSKSGPAFVRAQNIRFGELALHQLAHVQPPAKSEGSRTQVFVGDLLVVITGAGVTTPAVLEKDLGEAYVSQHVGLVRLTDASLSPWVLLCLMAQEGGRGELVERAYGAGRPGLNLENIRALSVPIPPLAEQHRIVAKVDALMALCDQLEAALSTAETTRTRLLEALLHEALEPAEKALEAAE